jgi:hypothetical protein
VIVIAPHSRVEWVRLLTPKRLAAFAWLPSFLRNARHSSLEPARTNIRFVASKSRRDAARAPPQCRAGTALTAGKVSSGATIKIPHRAFKRKVSKAFLSKSSH